MFAQCPFVAGRISYDQVHVCTVVVHLLERSANILSAVVHSATKNLEL